MHAIKLYKKLPNGKLKFIRNEMVADAPRWKLDFSGVAYRDAREQEHRAAERDQFETLVDAACEA